jgi:hypothetical protein
VHDVDSRSSFIPNIAKFYLIAMSFFIWGILTVKFEIFPHNLIAEPLHAIHEWIEGSGEGSTLSLSKKIQAEFFDTDTRYVGHSQIDKRFNLKLKKVRDPHNLLGKSSRKLYYYSRTDTGHYVFYVTLNLKDAKFAALVISAQGELKHVIKHPRKKRRRRNLGQGGVSDYGHIIFNSYFDLQVSDICGNSLLTLRKEKGKTYRLGSGIGYHHKASATQDSIWTWYGNEARRYSLQTKKLIQHFTLIDLIAANANLPIFEARLIKSNKKGHIGQWKYQDLSNDIKLNYISMHDPFHQNDIDVLTDHMASYFPQFKVGDLLLSFRSINLITIIDPHTLKVKWYSFGEFSRQHDPDWGYNGEIIVYDNQSHNQFSRILSIRIADKKITPLIDGRSYGFYQFAQGNQHYDQQKRVLFTNNAEAAQTGKAGIDFYFKYTNAKGKAIDIGTVHYVADDQYQKWLATCESK